MKKITKELEMKIKAQYFKDGQLTNPAKEIEDLRNSIWEGMNEEEKNKIYKEYAYKF